MAESSGGSMQFERIRVEPAYRRVAAQIAARIHDRSLNEGDALATELELAAQFEVTRSTLREALRELESQGLLERRRGTKRMVVTRPSAVTLVTQLSNALALHDVTVQEVWEALTILQPPIAERAARRYNAAQLAQIDAAVAAFAASGNTAQAIAAVSSFFDALDTAAGNRALMLAQRPLLPLLESSLTLMMDRVPQARSRIALAQRRLRAAIVQGDAVTAREWMAKHIRDFRRGFEVAGIDLSTGVARNS
ncbi:MAG: GntR family transcriptional regulator [Steroidobacteraceae bacterium]